MKFKNPTNGHIEEKSSPWLWTIFFSGFYFLLCGLWAPTIIWFVIAVLLYSALGGAATLLMAVVNIVFAFFANSMIRGSYLRKGWVEVADDAVEVPPTPPALTKKCPFCAEEVLAEAIKCKHCGSTIPAADSPVQEAPTVL